MSMDSVIIKGCRIYDRSQLLENHCLLIDSDQLVSVSPESANTSLPVIEVPHSTITLGFADLQVNGGGGLLLNDHPSVDTLQTLCEAHISLGTRCLLPTLITDTPAITSSAIRATKEFINEGFSVVAGLHLEGPHLSVEKKGAHSGNLIRKMQRDDLELLCQTAQELPVLKLTIAPENVSISQTQALVDAGAIVSLGHTNANYSTCMKYFDAGASCVTHLYNAMSQLGSREPGLVGAAITNSSCFAGIIADGVHVHEGAIKTAWMGKNKMHDRIFLVTDAMAVAGTTRNSFKLQNRTIHRANGRLVLEDGTLAGADLSMLLAIKWLVETVGIDLKDALAAAVSTPRKLLYGENYDDSIVGRNIKDIICIDRDLDTIRPLKAVMNA